MKTCGYDPKTAPAKALWRKLQWAKIRKRVMSRGKRPGDCLVLYLAGEEDLDRFIARKNGFSNYNLIAVEVNKKATDILRQKGVNVINGVLSDVVLAWKGSPQIDVIIADYTCGLNKEPAQLISAIISSTGIGKFPVISVNLMRGRDKYFTEIKANPELRKHCEGKHRGEGFLALLTHKLAFTKQWGTPDNPSGDTVEWQHFLQMEKQVYETMSPYFSEYPSSQGTLYFDSVIFTYTMRRYPIDYIKREAVIEEMRKIAAAKALRTQRLPGFAKEKILASAS
jgi:hypothetical protein